MFRIRIRRVHMFKGLPDPHPDPLDRGKNPRIRIRTKMSLIHNTAENRYGTGTIPVLRVCDKFPQYIEVQTNIWDNRTLSYIFRFLFRRGWVARCTSLGLIPQVFELWGLFHACLRGPPLCLRGFCFKRQYLLGLLGGWSPLVPVGPLWRCCCSVLPPPFASRQSRKSVKRMQSYHLCAFCRHF